MQNIVLGFSIPDLRFGSFRLQHSWSALHKAILGKNQAITNYLLRESANPFVRDKVSTDSPSVSLYPV